MLTLTHRCSEHQRHLSNRGSALEALIELAGETRYGKPFPAGLLDAVCRSDLARGRGRARRRVCLGRGLRGLDLSGFDRSRTDLRGADFRGANLTQAARTRRIALKRFEEQLFGTRYILMK